MFNWALLVFNWHSNVRVAERLGMEMKLDKNLVKSERMRRAWSQEHLAEVTGLSLRTIQRLESKGTASYESIRALASAFSLNVEDLSEVPPEPRPPVISPLRLVADWWTGRATAGFAAVVVAAVLFVSNVSWAENIMLDVGVSRNNDEMQHVHMMTPDGDEAEFRIEEELRVVISPSLQGDGGVLLTAKIYEYKDNEFVLSASPMLLTAISKEAEIKIGSDSGHSLKLVITANTSN